MAPTDPKQFRTGLNGIDFPADKKQLAEQAERNGAPEDVVRALRAMPPVEYANIGEVLSSVRIRDHQHDAQKANERRHHTHDNLAENEKMTPDNPIAEELGENRGS